MPISTALSSAINMSAVQALADSKKTYKRHRLMIVDKPQFSDLIQQMLSPRYDAICIDDAVCALKHIASEKPDMVIIEATVKGNGLQLAELMKVSPLLCDIPLIVTCLGPTDDIVKRVKGANIASLIAKPFRPSTLMTQIEIEILKSESSGLGEAENAPAVFGVFDRPSFDLDAFVDGQLDQDDDFFDLIQKDIQCQKVLLHLANTAYSPDWRDIDSFKLAVGMMGIQEAKSVVLCAQVFRSLKVRAAKGCVNWMSLCKYSLGTALIARSLSKRIGVNSDRGFVAGLFHDLGKAALGSVFADYYAEVRNLIQEKKVASVEAEKEMLGMTHAHVSMLMASAWGADEQVAGAIAWHHQPIMDGKHLKLAGLVYLAAVICTQLVYGSSGEAIEHHKTDGILDKLLWKLGLKPEQFDSFVEVGKKELVYASKVLNALFHK